MIHGLIEDHIKDAAAYDRLSAAEEDLVRAESLLKRAEPALGAAAGRLAARVTVLQQSFSLLLGLLIEAGHVEAGEFCERLAEALEDRTLGIEARFGGRLR